MHLRIAKVSGNVDFGLVAKGASGRPEFFKP